MPDPTRLELIEGWKFFADMLREDRARLYGGSISKLSPSPDEGLRDHQAHDSGPDSNTPDKVAPRSTRVRAGRKTSAVLAEFLQEQRQSNGNDSAQHDVGIYVEFLIALLGDKPLRSYTEDDFALLGRELANVPDRNGIPRGKARTLWDRFEFARHNGWEGLKRLSETSLHNRYRTGLNRFLKWAKGQKYLAEPVTISIVKSAENLIAFPRDAFTDEEVRQILSMPTFIGHGINDKWEPGHCLAQDHVYWGYSVMLLTGMRTSEVAQLRIEDIIDAGGWYFFNLQPFDPAKGRVARKDVTKLKTVNSSRSIPLDLLLIDLGLLDRANELQARGELRLFPEWLPYTTPSGRVQWDRPLTRDWQYRRRKLKLERKNISLYSARHCMGDRLDDVAVAQRTRDRLMGHAPTDAKGRYGRKRPADPHMAALLQSLETPAIRLMREILMAPIEAARRGEITLLQPWRR